jgi:hypothetical protein
MFGGLNRLLATAIIVVAVLVVPPAAFASGCGGGPSAEQVYKECVPGGGNGKSTHTHKANTHKANSGGQTSSTPVPIPPKTAIALKKAGKDQKSLRRLVTAYGLHRSLASSHGTPPAAPTAIGSAFDLGTGPTVLLVMLAGTAVLLLAAGGYRSLRHRHR